MYELEHFDSTVKFHWDFVKEQSIDERLLWLKVDVEHDRQVNREWMHKDHFLEDQNFPQEISDVKLDE